MQQSKNGVFELPPGSTCADLQHTLDDAAFGDLIQISGDMPFTSTVSIRTGLEVTICSGGKVLQHFMPGSRHFEVDGSLILKNIILDGKDIGGGVQLNQGAVSLMDGAVIENCFAVNGGAILVCRGELSILGGEIRSNTAQHGGGVYLTAGMLNMSASSCVIRDNNAINGGGVYVGAGNYCLKGGEISGNEAIRGGGLYIESGKFTMALGNFNNNRASVNGGGIYAAGKVEISGTACSITNNRAIHGDGGGIYMENADYADIATGSLTFRGNKASTAHKPPANARWQIGYSWSSIAEHPLNNYDINHTGGELLTYRLCYSANGGTGSYIGTEVSPCEEDMAVTSIYAGISREGYSFTRWNTRADGTGISYAPGDTVVLDKDITLFAQWRVNPHTSARGCRTNYTKLV